MNTLSKYTQAIIWMWMLLIGHLSAAQILASEDAREKIQMGKFADATKLLKGSAKETDIELLVEAYVKMGHITEAQTLIKTISTNTSRKLLNALALQYLGKYEEALDSINDINLNSAKDIHHKYNIIKALGIINWLNGNYSLAEYWLKDYHQNYALSNNLKAQSSNNLGLIYLQNDPSAAIALFEEGLRATSNASSLIQISLNNNLALGYKILGKTEEALNTFEKSLGYLGDQFLRTPIHAYILSNISQIYFEKNNLNKAIEIAENAQQSLKEYHKGTHPEIAANHNMLSGYYLAKRNYSKAYENLIQAFENNAEVISNDKLNLFYKHYKNFTNKRLFMETMILEAEFYELKYYHKNPKLSFLKKALTIYTSADSLLYEIRKNTKLENDKIALNKASTKLYDNAIHTALKIHELDFNKMKYYEIAYQFSEKSKSSILLDAINDSKSKKFANIPDSILKQESNIKAMISYYELRKTQIPTANIELIALYQQNSNLLKTLEVRYPKYFELKYQNEVLKIKSIQDKLGKDQMILNYYISDSKSSILCFIIHKNKVDVITNLKDEMFEKRLIALRNAISFNDHKLFIRSANYLSSNLINFKLPTNKHLIIIPDPKLANIPFDVLTSKKIKKDTTCFHNINYLINDHPISYYYSNKLFLLHEPPSERFISNALLCSPVNYKEGLASLPGAEVEIHTVDSILKSQGHKTDKILLKNATESNLKKLLNNPYKYVMISSHGIVNEMTPDRSQIFLNEGDNEDGHLYAGEIYNIKINTELLLLPCCQTGLGKMIKGEGVMGLSRALIYSGVQNMILSLWNVSDTHAQEISKFFFINLTQYNQSPAVSLQISKKKLLKSKESANPYLWAPYILIGK